MSVDAPFPPTMYTGPLEFRNGGGMPTVRHTKDDGSWRLHSSWTGSFDPDHDKVGTGWLLSMLFGCVSSAGGGSFAVTMVLLCRL